jgi:hypothetical protein
VYLEWDQIGMSERGGINHGFELCVLRKKRTARLAERNNVRHYRYATVETPPTSPFISAGDKSGGITYD